MTVSPAPAPASYVAPAPPAGLCAEAEALWRGVHEDYDAEDYNLDARELALLTEACRHLTLAEELAVALEETDLIVTGSMGQVRSHPLVADIDRTRKTLATMLVALKLPVDRSSVNRRNATAGTRSAAGRARAAAAR